MGRDRKQKLKKQEEKVQRQRARVREDYARVLAFMELDDVFEGFPESLKEFIYRFRYPRPEVVLDAGLENSTRAETILAKIERVLDVPMVSGPVGPVTATDFFRIAFSIRDALAIAEQAPLAQELVPWVSEAQRRVHLFFEDMSIWRLLFSGFDWFVLPYSRIDEGIYWCDFEAKPVDRGKLLHQIIVRREPAQRIQIVADGVPRTAYRCGASLGANSVQWATLPARCLGIDADANYPVYVQSHALNRFTERMRLGGLEGVLHDFMTRSFMDPKAVVQRVGKALIEYRSGEKKLGYFEVERIDEKALVRTFLFLTMEGTPEAEALRKRLRLRRPDLDHLGLNVIDTFLITDLQADEELTAIFEECGCGHLLRMSLPEARDKWLKGYAQDIRRHLGMKIV